jgi:hypothetical protein
MKTGPHGAISFISARLSDELVAEVAPHTGTQRALDRSEFIASDDRPGGFGRRIFRAGFEHELITGTGL